ncbi:MAG: flavodoxin family protein [Alistipes sp.]|nr:flavodoxin family protein [Alistipes sp.]MDE6862519.1 flavodoxin family protein [Alistipes sp.]
MKTILVISTSLRANSNSYALAAEFVRGAEEAGNNVELLTLADKDLRFCRGCLACVKSGKCTIKDDASEIVAKMHDADAIAFATPIYYYEMSGAMKTLLDRSNPLYDSDYRFTDIYMLSSAAEDQTHVPSRAISGLEGWIECFGRARLAGSVFAGGVTDPGDIAGHAALKTAYELGRSLG